VGTWRFDVYGLEVIPKDEAPLGKSYDYWIDKYWNWFIRLSTEEATPKDGGCLINKVDSMVMVMQPIFGGVRNQNCNISSGDAIMIPLWTAWCDSGANLDDISDPSLNLDQKLTKCAREVYNLGNIGSEVKVDNAPVSDLNVRMSLKPDSSLDYKINSMTNVSEIYSGDLISLFHLIPTCLTWYQGNGGPEATAGGYSCNLLRQENISSSTMSAFFLLDQLLHPVLTQRLLTLPITLM
jgi:hypothetical protein